MRINQPPGDRLGRWIEFEYQPGAFPRCHGVSLPGRRSLSHQGVTLIFCVRDTDFWVLSYKPRES